VLDFFDGRSWAFGPSVIDSAAHGWDGALGTWWLIDPLDLTVMC
jgi:hypothetical protein